MINELDQVLTKRKCGPYRKHREIQTATKENGTRRHQKMKKTPTIEIERCFLENENNDNREMWFVHMQGR